MKDYTFVRASKGTPDEALARLEVALKAKGFGILATLKVHDILREKIGAKLDPVLILDVCSPKDALQALTITREAALLLPCKIVISTEGGQTQISLLRPHALVHTLFPDPALERLSSDVEHTLQGVVTEVARS